MEEGIQAARKGCRPKRQPFPILDVYKRQLLKRPEQRDRMREAIRQVTGRVYKLGPYRLPQEQTETALDPLAELERRAREQGIALQEEGPSPTADSQEDDGPPPLTDAEIPF